MIDLYIQLFALPLALGVLFGAITLFKWWFIATVIGKNIK